MQLRIIFAIICFAVGLCSFGQSKISVGEFYYNEKDLTANRQGTMKRDQNGEVCALIRIQTIEKGFSFDVGSLGIVDVEEEHPAEIWVYVPFGVKRISIFHPKFGSLINYPIPVAIKKACTYVMELNIVEKKQEEQPTVTQQYVVFRLSPPNAVVELDNKTLTTIDGTAQDRKAFGKYGFRVTAPLYYPEVGKIEVNDPENKHIMEVKLRPAFANLTLKADSAAEIWVNGEKKGVGAWTGDLGYDTYLVETKKAGHRPTKQDVEVNEESAGDTLLLDTPTPIYGSLDISCTPADADIFIDNHKVGTTPLFIRNQLIGSHLLRISKKGYKDHKSMVEIREGKIDTVTVSLEKGEEVADTPTNNSRQSSSSGSYDVVEQMPLFPGGEAALLNYIYSHVRYPAIAMENGIQGTVMVAFVVNEDGSVSGVKTVKGVDSSLDKEAERVISTLPRFTPGKQNGKAVKVKYRLPVRFTLH